MFGRDAHSPLLFNIASEMLVSAVRTHMNVQGMENLNYQNKLSLYADDIVFFVHDPLRSMEALRGILGNYSIAPVYVNKKKIEVQYG